MSRYEVRDSTKGLSETLKDILSEATNPLSATIQIYNTSIEQQLPNILECSNVKNLLITKEQVNKITTTTTTPMVSKSLPSSSGNSSTSTVSLNQLSNIKSDILINEKTIIEFNSDESNFSNIEFKNLILKSNETSILFNNINIKFSNCQIFGIQLQFKGKCQVEIDNCDVKYSQMNGIEVTDESKATIKNSNFTNNDKNGIRLIKNSQATIDRCSLNDNLGNGIVMQDDSNVNITNSIMKLNQTFGVLSYHRCNITINGNIITNNKQCGLYLTNTDSKTIVKDNQIFKNEEHGITIGGISNLGEMEILNNQINNNTYYGIHVIDGVGIPIKVEGNKLMGNQSGPLKDDTIAEFNAKDVLEFTQHLNKNSQVLSLENNEMKFTNANCLLN